MFKDCPNKYRVIRFDKQIKDIPGKAAELGSQIHAKIEEYLNTGVFPSELLKWEKLLRETYERKGEAEKEYAFNKNLEKVDFKAPDVWVRAIIDWIKIENGHASIIDWKTGKVSPSKQMQFYAWIIFTAHPEVETVESTFHWINHNDKLTERFYRDQKDSYFESFGNTLREINNCIVSSTWPEQTGFHCRWCPVTKEYCSNGK